MKNFLFAFRSLWLFCGCAANSGKETAEVSCPSAVLSYIITEPLGSTLTLFTSHGRTENCVLTRFVSTLYDTSRVFVN